MTTAGHDDNSLLSNYSASSAINDLLQEIIFDRPGINMSENLACIIFTWHRAVLYRCDGWSGLKPSNYTPTGLSAAITPNLSDSRVLKIKSVI